MKTLIVLRKFKGLPEISNGPRLTFFAPFAPPLAAAPPRAPMSAGNPTLPNSLEEWLVSVEAIEIGNPTATPEAQPVINA